MNRFYLRRCHSLWALALLLASSLAWGVTLANRHDRVTRANYSRIKNGMTLCEVEAILGPPGDYTAWPHPSRINEVESLKPIGGTGEEWRGEQGLIQVGFDRNGRAEQADFVQGPPYARRLIWEWQRMVSVK